MLHLTCSRRLKKLQLGRNRLAVLDLLASITHLTQARGPQGVGALTVWAL